MSPHADDEAGPVASERKLSLPLITTMLVAALLCHLGAAQLNGGGWTPYWHHVAGFFFIAAITGLPIAGLTRLFWRRQLNRALIVFALIQLLLGLAVVLGEWQKR